MIGFYIFTSLSALLGYFLFIPRFSYIGAASITIYSEVLIAIFSAFCVFKITRFLPRLKIFFRSLGACMFMAFFIYIIPLPYQTSLMSLIAVLIGATVTYFVALFIFQGISSTDLKILYKKTEQQITPLFPDNKTDLTSG